MTTNAVDETSWHEGTRKPWLWVAVSAVATLFLLLNGYGINRGKLGSI